MTLTPNSFLKVISGSVLSADVTAGNITRTYSSRIEDPTTIVVYYNGQEILGGQSPYTASSKYYYNYILTYDSTTAGSFIVGNYYKITSIGTTDFTLIGAATNTVGLTFIATGVGSGTGTASNLDTTKSSIEFIISPSLTYEGPGYASGTSAVSISVFDVFTICYYYTIYSA